jgi:hypothetical protein
MGGSTCGSGKSPRRCKLAGLRRSDGLEREKSNHCRDRHIVHEQEQQTNNRQKKKSEHRATRGKGASPQHLVAFMVAEGVQLEHVKDPVESVQLVVLTFRHVPRKDAVELFTAKEYGHEFG